MATKKTIYKTGFPCQTELHSAAGALRISSRPNLNFDNNKVASVVSGKEDLHKCSKSNSCQPDKQRYPLVTIAVITYNSSKYIVDTLNSTRGQTYPNIELVISDDCSTDNTPQLIEEWLSEHEGEFVSARFVQTPRNIGVSGNCNNAIRNGKGEWIKFLSGDDQFLPETVGGFMDYVRENPHVNICGCKFRFVSDVSEWYLNKMTKFYEDTYYPFMKSSLKHQKRKAISDYIVPVAGPCIMFSRKLWESVGGFDERYPFAEEEPFFFRVLYSGNKIHFVDKELYVYNFRAGSLGHESGTSNLNRFQLNRIRYYFDERFKLKMKHGYWFDGINTYLTYKSDLARRLGKRKTALALKILRRCSPYMIVRYFEYRKSESYGKE